MNNKAKVRLILKDKTIVAIKGYKELRQKTGDKKEEQIRSERRGQQVKLIKLIRQGRIQAYGKRRGKQGAKIRKNSTEYRGRKHRS